MEGKQVTELDALPSFTDNSLLPVHNGAGLKKGLLSQLVSYLGTKFSNPNLLINPDFKINQRGSTNYTSNGYTVDRWKVNNGTVNTSPSGVTVTLNSKGQFIQLFENALSGTYTATIKVTSITGDCVLFIGSHSLQLNKAGTFTITENGSINGISLYKSTAGTCTINVEYIKLEQGSVATPFVAPNPAEELNKCYRFKYIGKAVLRGRCTAGQIFGFTKDLPTALRIKPTTSFKSKNSYNVNTVDVTLAGENNAVYLAGTAENTNQTVIEVVLDLDAEIY